MTFSVVGKHQPTMAIFILFGLAAGPEDACETAHEAKTYSK